VGFGELLYLWDVCHGEMFLGMKLKEKLVREYSLDFTETVQGVIADAYLAGFEKAREMARTAIGKYSLDTYTDDKIFAELDSLGEEEVE
jgi:hypothetical protein